MTSVANLFLGFCNSSSGGKYPSHPFVIIQNTNTIATSPAPIILQNHTANFFLKVSFVDTCFPIPVFCFLSIVYILDCLLYQIILQRYNKKCTFAIKSYESLLSSAILLQMGCIVRQYFRENWRSQGGVRRYTPAVLCEGVARIYTIKSCESLLSSAILLQMGCIVRS